MKDKDIPIWEKANLTVEEAAVYFGIGRKKLQDLARQDPSADYILWIGTKLLIKREQFQKRCNEWNKI